MCAHLGSGLASEGGQEQAVADREPAGLGGRATGRERTSFYRRPPLNSMAARSRELASQGGVWSASPLTQAEASPRLGAPGGLWEITVPAGDRDRGLQFPRAGGS